MLEILTITTDDKSALLSWLKRGKVDYEITSETPKIDIFADYDKAIQNKEREEELILWDNVDLDEELNQYGEWWS